MPVRPAMTAGIHPPDGVIDTTHPEVSEASMDVVPRVNASSNAASAAPSSGCSSVWLPPPDVAGVRAGGGPVAEQVQVGVRPPLEGIGVARLDARIVAIGIYQVRPLPRVVLREQAPDRQR